ncbi:MAG TPA: MaoC family dehydratase N-terminal domain-containing protein [Thermoleophilaceae bacterium]
MTTTFGKPTPLDVRDAVVAQFEITRDAVRAYADVVGHREAVYRDPEAARRAGYPDLVAPPMFAAVYAAPAVWPAMAEAVGTGMEGVLHGAQEFRWSGLAFAGDAITTEARAVERTEAGGLAFHVVESISSNAAGEELVRGRWMAIRRERP